MPDVVAAKPSQEVDLAEAIRHRFASCDGAELDLPPRLPDRDPPRFD